MKRAWKMHFSAPSQWNEMCFVHQRIIFQGKKGQHFHICLRSGWERCPLDCLKSILAHLDHKGHNLLPHTRYCPWTIKWAQKNSKWGWIVERKIPEIVLPHHLDNVPPPCLLYKCFLRQHLSMQDCKSGFRLYDVRFSDL